MNGYPRYADYNAAKGRRDRADPHDGAGARADHSGDRGLTRVRLDGHAGSEYTPEMKAAVDARFAPPPRDHRLNRGTLRVPRLRRSS